MADRVYRANLPAYRKALEKLESEFSAIESKTDWTRLRVEPLLRHVEQLEQQLKTEGTARLRMGVRMFRSDLVYLRENVKGLRAALASEQRQLGRRIKLPGRRGG